MVKLFPETQKEKVKYLILQPELKNLLRQVEGWHIDKERLERQPIRF